MQKIRLVALLVAPALAAGASLALAQLPVVPPAPPPPFIDWDKIQIRTIDLGNRTYMLMGQGGNITVAVGSEGVMMVDSQFPELSDRIKAAIKQISPLPIKYLVNTHFHRDHTGGNENFAKDGAVVVAHDNIRVRLAAGTISMMTGARAAPRPVEALPKLTYYGGSFTLDIGGRKPQLTHVANAHTDGDTFNNLRRYQNIDYANGGDVRGMIRALDAYLKVANDNTKIVPGHGP
ncbi:MAG TPA: MBL fold metallo-hydrolase, partial [Xanthobacteraceae bacterium]|nr:MBL fold metallo-hydrolase [Xanthobacteraceae bacterium]